MATKKNQQEIIKAFMKSLDTTTYSGKKALDQAVKYASGGYFSDITAAINQMVADCKSLGADKFLLQKCGINLSNKDVGAITGSDAGGSKVKTAESIVPEVGKLDTTFKAKSFETGNGLTFTLSKSNLTKDETYIWQGLKTWWAEESLNLIKESFDYSFNDSDATVKEIRVVFKNESNGGYLAYVEEPQKISGRYMLTLNINKAYFKNFKSTNVDGATSASPSYLDRTIAHELTHAVMMAKVNNYDKLPTFIKEGVAELTRGVDDLRTSIIKKLAGDSAKLKSSLSLSATTFSSTYTYAGGYIFLRYLAKQGSENYAGSDTDSATETSDNTTTKNSILTVAKNFSGNTINLDSSVKTVNASALTKGISIVGNSGANSILAGAGNDTLSGGAGNDTLTGGNGNDTFIYSAGNDIITDYTSDDKIKFNVAVSKTKVSGSDIVFTTSKGTLTVKNGKGKTFNITDSAGKEHAIAQVSTTLTLTNAAPSSVSAASSVKVINASKRTQAINITGNSGANSIMGGSGNDTLSGGAGKDTLTGGNGNDTFIYSAGNDIITDYTSDDKIKFNVAVSKTKASGSDIVFTTNKGTLTVKNGKGKTFNITDSAGKEHAIAQVSTTLTLTNAAPSSVSAASSVKVINASKRTQAINITGNSGANSIMGGSGNDTLRGGAGNDSLWGNAGADTFIYSKGGGNDIIFGFEDSDTLTIDNLNFTTSYNAKNKTATFNVSGGSITLKDFTATTFHVNNDVYKISGTKLVKK